MDVASGAIRIWTSERVEEFEGARATMGKGRMDWKAPQSATEDKERGGMQE